MSAQNPENTYNQKLNPAQPILSIQDLKVHFWTRNQWVRAVDGVSIEINAGEGVAIIGESGSGKTLSMLSSLALIPGQPGVVGGQITYRDQSTQVSLLDGVERAYVLREDGCEVTRYAETWQLYYRKMAQQLAGCKIGIIFQNPISSLDPLWSVGATLIESIRLRSPEIPKREARDEAISWLDRVHIKNPQAVMRSYPHQLSGGMCQRVMIAATLAMRPQIIIADEPTTGLDMTSKAQILYLLHEARMQYNSSLIFVTHEIGLATGLTDRIIVMKEGKIVDHFPTNYLADVSLKNSELQIPHDLALHTRELLHASLTLESKTSLHNTL